MGLEIRPVHSKGDTRRFLELPYRLYRKYRFEPNWVPPLRLERRQHIDPRRNPFFEHAEVQFFLAVRDGRVVGRVSAHRDDNFQAFQDNKWGFFGFFECEEDLEASRALLDAAERWLRDHGCDRMVGPLDFTTNDQCGVVIEGFERPPVVLLPWTHRYYPALFDDARMGKAMDLLMWELRIEGKDRVHPAIWELAEKVQSEHGVVVRPFVKRDLEAEVGRFIEVYNEAWERNWGFVPLTPSEVRHYAKTLKPVLSEDWAFVAEKDGKTVGAALSLPDYNQVLAHMNGRILPIGWAKALWYRRKIDRCRVFALGVKRDWQHTGVAAKFYERHFDAAERTPITWGEMGWILETNKPMNRAMEGMGGTVVRRLRLYERGLG